MYHKTMLNRIKLLWCIQLAMIIFIALMLSIQPVVADATTQHDIVFVLDNSGSMKRGDPDFMIKKVLTTFAQNMPIDSRLAVVLFDTDATVLVPLIQTSGSGITNISNSLKQITYNGQFTNIPAGIERALYHLKLNSRDHAKKTIILAWSRLLSFR